MLTTPAHHHRAPAALRRRMGLQPPRATDLSRHSFGSGPPFTVGVEEELFLVDPLTGAPDQRVDGRPGARRAGRRDGGARAARLPARAHHRASARAPARRSTRSTACGAPSSPPAPGCSARARIRRRAEGDAEITDKERYERIRDLLGDAVATPVGGLHIHVGMPDAETAIRAFNGLRRHLPLLQALAANSPFRHGRDTGLASAREVTHARLAALGRAARDARLRGLLRHGARCWRAPPTCRTTRGSGGSCARTRASGPSRSARSTRRPRSRTPPRWSRSRTAWPATPPSAEPGLDPRPEVLEEGMFRAARFGVAAELPGPRRPPAARGRAARGRARRRARSRGRAAVRGRARRAARRCCSRGGGAGRQRAAHEIGGMGALLRELTEVTAAGTPRRSRSESARSKGPPVGRPRLGDGHSARLRSRAGPLPADRRGGLRADRRRPRGRPRALPGAARARPAADPRPLRGRRRSSRSCWPPSWRSSSPSPCAPTTPRRRWPSPASASTRWPSSGAGSSATRRARASSTARPPAARRRCTSRPGRRSRCRCARATSCTRSGSPTCASSATPGRARPRASTCASRRAPRPASATARSSAA